MGQKVHPFGFRLGFNKTWRSRWYSDRDYAKLLHEDLALRSTLKKRVQATPFEFFYHIGRSAVELIRWIMEQVAGISKTVAWKKCAFPWELRTCGNVPSAAVPVPTRRGRLFIHD